MVSNGLKQLCINGTVAVKSPKTSVNELSWQSSQQGLAPMQFGMTLQHILQSMYKLWKVKRTVTAFRCHHDTAIDKAYASSEKMPDAGQTLAVSNAAWQAEFYEITLQALFEGLAFGGQSWAEVCKVCPQAESLLWRVCSLLVCSALKVRTSFQHQLQTWTTLRLENTRSST